MSSGGGLVSGGKSNGTRDGPRPITIFQRTDVEREHRGLHKAAADQRNDWLAFKINLLARQGVFTHTQVHVVCG